MRGTLSIALTLAAAAGWGCASAAPNVPVSGEAAAIEALAGSWVGRYESPQTGRFGSLTFRLEAGRDTARGDVQMVPAGADRPLHAFDRETDGAREPAGNPASFLRIRFVTVGEGDLRGCLEPYEDPVTGHSLLTTFRGQVRGDSIEGTFQTVDDRTGARSAGTWWAARREAR